MKRNIIIGVLILITALLSYQIEFFEFVLIGLIFLSILFIIPVGIIYVFRRIEQKFFRVPLLIICVCLAGIIASLFRPYDDAVLQSGTASEKLQHAYATDQKDRMQIRSFIKYFSDLEHRDRVRLSQVKEIFEEEEESLKPIDKFYAAFVFHHSNNSNDYKIASRLASAAAEDDGLKDNYQVQWLGKAAYDRYMLSIGKPEKYNTQNKFSIDFE